MRTLAVVTVAVVLAGCCTQREIVKPVEVLVTVPEIWVDTVRQESPDEVWNHMVDSVLAEMAARPSTPPPPFFSVTGERRREYFGRWGNERGDSVSVLFRLEREPSFAFNVHIEPVETTIVDTTYQTIVKEMGFWEKLGLVGIGVVIGAVVLIVLLSVRR